MKKKKTSSEGLEGSQRLTQEIRCSKTGQWSEVKDEPAVSRGMSQWSDDQGWASGQVPKIRFKETNVSRKSWKSLKIKC
jgi:hypothetical protein